MDKETQKAILELEMRVNAMETTVIKALVDFKAEISYHLLNLQNDVNRVDHRLHNLETKVDRLETKVDRLETEQAGARHDIQMIKKHFNIGDGELS